MIKVAAAASKEVVEGAVATAIATPAAAMVIVTRIPLVATRQRRSLTPSRHLLVMLHQQMQPLLALPA